MKTLGINFLWKAIELITKLGALFWSPGNELEAHEQTIHLRSALLTALPVLAQTAPPQALLAGS